MAKEFGRHFSQSDIAALEKRPAWWQDILAARFEDKNKQKRPLMLAVRNGYLNAYAEGQSILKIEFKGAPGPERVLCGSIHHKYVIKETVGQKYLCFDGQTAGEVNYDRLSMLEKWIETSKEFTKPEKEGVAIITDNNPNVIDVEMALPGHRSRIDMVALERHGSAIRIAFYEAKCFSNSSLVSNEKPEVFKQIRKYNDWLVAAGREQLLVASYRRTCQVLLALREMQEQTPDPLIVEAAEEGSNLVIDHNPRLVIFGYNPSSLHANWQTMHKPKLENHGLRVSVSSWPLTLAA